MKHPETDNIPPFQPGLPVSLRVKDSDCLVVGGGPVAYRKVMTLKAYGAAVHVVSPELCTDLAALATAGQVTHIRRRFTPADTGGMRIVFAATDDSDVNRRVLDSARTSGAFCCCADANWKDSDFITPAVLQKDGLTVAVSTGGRSCRQARMVKDTLQRHLRSIETADLLILGASHEELALEKRETVQLSGSRQQETGAMLMHVWGIHEFMLLNTCNRVELVAVASASAANNRVLEKIMGFDRLNTGEWYRLTGPAAFEHLALVTAGMLSQSPGEYHVASQVKQALQTAAGNGWANGMLHTWIAEALHISKHVKNEIIPLLPPAEIEDMAIAYINEQQGENWNERTVMVMGTGTLGNALVANTVKKNARCLWCYHTNRPLPDSELRDRIRIITMDEINHVLDGCDIVFCAMEAPGHVLDLQHASCFKRNQPVTLVDLGIPRNINPALAHSLPNANLVNLDVLKSWAIRRNGDLERAMSMSRATVKQHSNGYNALINSFQGRNKSQ